MYNIANEEAAADYMAEATERWEYVEYAMRHLPNEYNNDIFRDFAFAFAGTYFQSMNPDKDDFMEMVVQMFEFFDKSKIDEFIEKYKI